jgi:putative lipoic acid-binding regulatory protein
MDSGKCLSLYDVEKVMKQMRKESDGKFVSSRVKFIARHRRM